MTQVVISRKLAPSPAQHELEDRLCDLITAHGSTLLITPDLYHIPEDSALWTRLVSLPHSLLLIGWQQPRALEAITSKHNINPVKVVSLSKYSSATEAFDAIEAFLGTPDDDATITEADEPATARWYPVVDQSRCTNCGHCYQFCLFNVYEKDTEGQVHVVNPDNCKPGCPACARICPSSAIMFPEYTQSPEICGVPGCYVTVDEKAAAMFRERVKRHVSAETSSEVFDEIDSLIDELSDLTDGGKD